MMKTLLNFFPLLFFVGLSGCASLTQQNHLSGEQNAEQKSPVDFKLHPDYQNADINCIAIMPLEIAIKSEKNSIEMTAEQVEQIRLVLYSHLAPAKFKDIELTTIDSALLDLYSEERSNYKKIAEAIECKYLLIGKITEYSKEFLALYSRIGIGADLKLINIESDQVLWEGKYVAQSHATAFPLSPIGIAKGLYDTTTHLSDEQVLKVSDELARELVSTIPVPSPTSLKYLVPYSVIAKSLNIRSGPGRSYDKTGVLHNSDQVSLVDNIDSSPWLKIKTTDGLLGYVHGKYVRELVSSVTAL